MDETSNVIYEFPCNEKIRTCLRLEKSILRQNYFIEQDNAISYLSAFDVLFDLIELTTRPDLRKDLIQELQRNRSVLSSEIPPLHMDPLSIKQYLDRIEAVIDSLVKPNPGIKSPQSLRDNDWLNTIRARSQMPGGNCCFDLPSLHYWLGKPFEERHAQFLSWLAGTVPFKNAVDLILQILRSSVEHRSCSASSGSVNLQMPPQCSWSLIQIAMPRESICIPEVSVNKFMLWIHFLDATASMKTPPSRANIDFDLGLCAI